MDRKEWIAVGIGVAVLAALFVGILLLRGCVSSDNGVNDVVPETGSVITDDLDNTMSATNDSSGGTFGVQSNVNVSDVNTPKNTQMFFLKLDNDIITIYKDNGEFYDYAQVDVNSLPKDVLGELKMGMEIIGEDSLYEFLQGYAS